jgi:hypothetical protein
MAEKVFPGAPVSTAAGRVISSPFQFVTTGEDNLRVVAVNVVSGARLAIQGRRLSSAGVVEAFAFTHTPNSDRTVTTQDYALGVGAILNLTIFATGATPLIGQTFVQAKLIRGLGGATVVLGTLLQGYVTSTQELAWPGSPIVSSIESGGYYRAIVGTTPAAGGEIAETVPTGVRWDVRAVFAQLQASAAPGTRNPALAAYPGAQTFALSLQPLSLAAGAGGSFFWGEGLVAASEAATSRSTAPIPVSFALLGGHVIRTVTGGLLAGDQWTAPQLLVREWFEVP